MFYSEYLLHVWSCCQVASSYRDAISSSVPCIHEGHLKTDRNWFGYLANITIVGSGRLTFEFIYPVERCCQNILFYRQDQLAVIGSSHNAISAHFAANNRTNSHTNNCPVSD